MNEIVYLETDEEITSVIDRLKKAKEDAVALVIPRGGTLAQSIVNLKLLKKSAGELGKEISLISNDRISRNLASQIGLTVYSKVSEAEKAGPRFNSQKNNVGVDDSNGDFKVNSYYDSKGDDELAGGAVLPASDQKSEQSEEDSEQEQKTEGEPEQKEMRGEENEEPKIEREESFTRKEAKLHNKGFDRDHQRRFSAEDGKKKRSLSKTKKIIIGVVAGCLILLSAVSYLFLPYATASIQVKTDDLSITEETTVDKDQKTIDQEKLIVPGTIVEIEKEVSKTYQSTGKKEQGEKATGKISITNNWDENIVNIPIGSKFVAGSKIFLSLAAVDLPGVTDCKMVNGNLSCNVGKIDVNVEAENPGESYNLGPSDFIITSLPAIKQSAIKGHSVSAMTGGTTKTISVVADSDLTNAETDLSKTINDLAKNELGIKADGEKLKIIDSKITSELISKESSKNINDEASEFDYRVKMKLSVLAYSISDFKKVLTAKAEKEQKSDKMLINPEKFEVSIEEVLGSKDAPGLAKLKTTLKGKTGQRISDQEIKNKIKNKKYSEAKAIIKNYDKVEDVNFQIWPTSIARVPLMGSRIKINFDYAQ